MQDAFHTGCNPLFKFFFIFIFIFILFFGLLFSEIVSSLVKPEDIQPVMGKAANLCEHATRIVI